MIFLKELGVKAELSKFVTDNGIAEIHAILHVDPKGESFAQQLERLYKAEDHLRSVKVLRIDKETCEELQQGNVVSEDRLRQPEPKTVFKRYFLSDATNQMPLMREEKDCAVSVIQQPPLDGSKVAVWIYMVQESEESVPADTDDADDKKCRIEFADGMMSVRHNGYNHLWTGGMVSPEGDSAAQTDSLLNSYLKQLDRHGATLEANCVRTWFFVRDVDTQYKGMVKARKELFEKQGLTNTTHYIASTGIGGNPADTKALVQLDTYALTGFQPEQQKYLYAPTHLNPTYEYGVTFERGVRMEYGDRSHVYISGTASINNKGEVVHTGDVVAQTRRMWENVETLLSEAETSYDDVMQMIVYLRDIADYPTIKAMYEERFPDIPTLFTLAPVCRPTWLIEMECIAVAKRENAEYRRF